MAGVVISLYIASRLRSEAQAVKVYTLRVGSSEGGRGALSSRVGRTLRVGAFNIAHGRGPGEGKSNWSGGDEAERTRRLDAIGRQIKANDLDLLVLNEVDFDSSWSGRTNQARFLAQAAGFNFVVEQRNFDVALPALHFRFGNALLSKLPIRRAEPLPYPALSRIESVLVGRKNGLLAELELPWATADGQGATLRVVPVHFEPRSEAVRVESARLFHDLLNQESSPLLLLGDFNSTFNRSPGGELTQASENAIDVMLSGDAFATIVPKAGVLADTTFPIPDPKQTLDWIFVSSELQLGSKEVVQSPLSDHAMIVAEIRSAETR